MTISDIIKAIGTDEEVGEKVGRTPRAVKAWRLGARRPRPDEALRLVALCPKSVTLDDVYRAA